MQRALITHFISSGVQEGQLRLWNVSSWSQSNESDWNANFIRAVIYLYGLGEKKKFAYFLSVSGENAHPVVLRP